jgi:glutathione S-transferase
MHAGFHNLRSALPMNMKARHHGFKVWAGAQADIDRIVALWQDCLRVSDGPYLFGASPTMADAMYAPVCSRFVTYEVDLPDDCLAYVRRVMALPDMIAWTSQAAHEPDELEELEAEF